LQAAECCDALDRIQEALHYFRLSLDAQSRFPNIDPGTNLEYPWFIVSRGLVDLYGEALDALQRYRGVFPAQWFKAAAIRALIADHNGERDQASQYASDALEAASQKQSPFRYHPSLGLVGQGHSGIIERLRHIAAGVA